MPYCRGTGQRWSDNNLSVLQVRKGASAGDMQTLCYLKESEGRHPTGPGLLVLRTQQPQLLHLPSTFIGLGVTIETDTLNVSELETFLSTSNLIERGSSPLPSSKSHLDAKAVVVGRAVLLFARGDGEDVAVFQIR